MAVEKYLGDPGNEVGSRAKLDLALFLLLQRALFLGVLDRFLLHVKSLPAANRVHVLASLVVRVGLVSKVEILFLCGGDPERIYVYHLPIKWE